jgi:hypothetical protein
LGAWKGRLLRIRRTQDAKQRKERVMQAEDPMLSILRLAVAEARAVMGQAPRTPSFERDVARLCLVVAIVSGRRVAVRLHARLARSAIVRIDRHRSV